MDKRCRYRDSVTGKACKRSAHKGQKVCSDCACKVHYNMMKMLYRYNGFGFAVELDKEFNKLYGKAG